MKPYITFLVAIAMLALVVLVLSSSVSVSAKPSSSVWFVAPSGSDGNTCQSPTAPCATVNGALGKTAAGDTIRVAIGIYTGAGFEVVLLNKDTTLSGGWNGTFTTQNGVSTVDGQNARRGITVSGGVTAIVEHFIVRNGSANWGGGVFVDAGTLTLNVSSVLSNTAADMGGGISQNGGNLNVNNTTVGGNVAANYGGGIDVYAGTLTLKNATISGNSASGASVYTAGSGGGVYKHDGTVLVQNSIVAKNNAKSSPDCAGAPISLGYNLIGNSSGCNFTSNTGDLVDVNARLVPVASLLGFFPLYSDSPAVDAGNPSGCTDHAGNPLSTDQRGLPRVGRCDMGAYEYTAPGPAANIFAIDGTPQHTRPATTFLTPLKAAVLDSLGNPVSNVTVTLTAPSAGASATFSNTDTFTASILTDGGGIVSAALRANGTWGSYIVSATVGGVMTPANFLLGNIVWYVAQDGSDTYSCQTPIAACATINEPFGKVDYLDGDIVFVATGTYTATGAEVVLIDKGVSLSGGWNRSFTTRKGLSVVDGQGARRAMTVSSGVTAAVDRFVLSNGYVNNRDGGGVFSAGVLTLTNSAVVGNRATGITNSTLSSGGGIYNDQGVLHLIGTTVNANSAEGGGGGILNTGTLDMTSTTISDNTGRNAGGIVNAGVAQISSSTITRNKPAEGISNFYPDGVTIRNSILAGNIIDCKDQLTSAGYNIIGTLAGCTYFKSSIGDLTNVDPKLGLLEGSPAYHPLLLGSPAINAGNPAGCTDHLGNPLPFDQRGYPRVGRCDIGAVETQELELSEKIANLPQIAPGGTIGYKILVRNTSDAAIGKVVVSDVLPSSLTYYLNSLKATVGSYGYAGGVITWTGSMNAGAVVTIAFGATADPTANLGSFITNSVAISGAGKVSTHSATIPVDGQACNLSKYAGNPVLAIGANGQWDDASVSDPVVLKDGSIYKMWYSGYDGSIWRIGYATSPDGIHWTKYSGNPVLSQGPLMQWDSLGVFAPSVMYDNGIYQMWYTGKNDARHNQIGYASSPDGIIWTKYSENPILRTGPGDWESVAVQEPTVIKVGSTFHMWYTGDDGATLRIGHASAVVFYGWEKDPYGAPALSPGSPGAWDWLDVYGPGVTYLLGQYRLWYSGKTLPPAYQTGYAVSQSGSSAWTGRERLIPEGQSGAFDSDSADFLAAIIDGPQYKIWYSGLNQAGIYNIGYATAGACGPSGLQLVYLPILLKGETCSPYYTDSFADPTSGWPISNNSNRKYAYINGEYQIWAKNPNQGWAVTPDAKATDFTVSVSARRASGTTGSYGIDFGINANWTQYYEVLIDGNAYSIWRYSYTWTPLKNWTTSSAIATGTGWNRLKIIRIGTNINVYINNRLLTTVNDGIVTGPGRIGLVAESDDVPLDARFDNFSLYPANCGAGAAR